MVAGRESTQTLADINGTVGGICAEIDHLMTRIGTVQGFMLRTTLTAAPYSMVQGDSDIVKGAMTVLEAVHQQYLAQANITFVQQCIGIPTS